MTIEAGLKTSLLLPDLWELSFLSLILWCVILFCCLSWISLCSEVISVHWRFTKRSKIRIICGGYWVVWSILHLFLSVWIHSTFVHGFLQTGLWRPSSIRSSTRRPLLSIDEIIVSISFLGCSIFNVREHIGLKISSLSYIPIIVLSCWGTILSSRLVWSWGNIISTI